MAQMIEDWHFVLLKELEEMDDNTFSLIQREIVNSYQKTFS